MDTISLSATRPELSQVRCIYLAGPDSGKTHVLPLRTVNRIVNHDMQPRETFLSISTETVKNHLRNLLAEAVNRGSRPFYPGDRQAAL